jgi:hypothetical protein
VYNPAEMPFANDGHSEIDNELRKIKAGLQSIVQTSPMRRAKKVSLAGVGSHSS